MHTMPDASDLMKAADVAAIFKVTPSTVSRWGRNGTLRTVKVGTGKGTVRYRREDVDALLEQERAS